MLPVPADVETVDNGRAGCPEAGDEVVFTFAGTVDPNLILVGWDGSATGVTVHIEGSNSDLLTVHDSTDNSVLTELGTVQTNGDYADSADFTGSQMTLGGSAITIVLGTPTGTVYRDPSAKTMVWTTPQGSATESGHPDSNF
jgi:hypothetical protein